MEEKKISLYRRIEAIKTGLFRINKPIENNINVLENDNVSDSQQLQTKFNDAGRVTGISNLDTEVINNTTKPSGKSALN